MHCSDEQLISYLDGEVSIFGRAGIRAHLQRCWHCRGRLDTCERKILSLSEAVEQWSFPEAGWNDHAKSRLNRRFASVERTLPAVPHTLNRIAILASAAVCAALICAIVWIPQIPQQQPKSAVETVQRATSAESALFRAVAVKQEMAVVVEEIRPVRTVRRSRIEAISDSGTGRYTASLRNEHGVVQQILWKPDAHSEYVYQPARSAAVGRQSPRHKAERLFESIGETVLDAEQVEGAFMHWLETRSWRPITLTTDLAVLAHRSDTILRMEKVRGEAGDSIIRVTASRTDKSQLVGKVTLELDASSYRPRLERLQLERDGRQIELRISLTEVREIPQAALAEVSFSPPTAAAPALSDAERMYQRTDIRSEGPPPLASSVPDLDARVQALYALHQAGACLGSAVEISESPGGVLVRERTVSGADSRAIPAGKAGMAEVLTALGEIRGSIADDRALQASLRLYTAALRVFLRMPPLSSDLVSESSVALLQTMFSDHIVLLTRSLDDLRARPEADNAAPYHLASLKPASANFAERVTALADALDGLQITASRDYLQALATQARELDALYSEQLAGLR